MYNVTQNFDNHHRDSRGSRPSARLAGLLLAIAAIAVLLIMPTAPTAAQAAEVTLVKNTGQTFDSNPAPMNAGVPATAAGFTTGNNTEGYTLSSFALRTSTAADTDHLTVTLNEATTDSSNNTVPGNAVCTLTNPARFEGAGLTTFAAPGACGTLAANTTYFAVLTRGASATWDVNYAVTSSDAEDEGGASGWSIANDRLRQLSDSSDWGARSSTPVIEIKGTIVTAATNSAATGAPTISGNPQVGEALTAETFGIGDDNGLPDDAQGFDYQWQRSDDGNAWTDIDGATAPNYWPLTSDAGKHIRVQVSFEDGDGYDEGPINSVGKLAWQQVHTANMMTDSSTVAIGYKHGDSDYPTAVLNPDSFTYQGVTYKITELLSFDGEDLTLVLDPKPSNEIEDHLALVIGTERYPLRGAYETIFQSYIWRVGTPTWTDGQNVRLSMQAKGIGMTTNGVVEASTTVGVPWSTTMTAGEENGGAWDGFLGQALSAVAESFGSISNTTIDFARGPSYSVAGLVYDPAIPPVLTLYTDPELPADFTLAYGADVKLNSAGITTGTEQGIAKQVWSDHEARGWLDGYKIALALLIDLSPHAATGAPSVTGPLNHGEVLSVDLSGIMDENGLPTDPGEYSYQWIRVSGATETDIPGATHATYTLKGTDVGKRIKVEVSFRDLADHNEGPLKSAATQVVASGPPFNICGRASWLQNELLKQTPTDDTCVQVSRADLEAITTLDFSTFHADAEAVTPGVNYNTAHLREDAFDGLIGLTTLDLSNMGIGAIHYESIRTCPLPPRGPKNCANVSSRIHGPLFAGLTSLQTLRLRGNKFSPLLADDAFKDLANLTELDLRGFSRNAAGRDGTASTSPLGRCWTNEEKARKHPKYPWNPRTGSPNAFIPLTSLQTYNWDNDFNTSHISGYDYTPAPYASNNYSIVKPPTNVRITRNAGLSATVTWDAPAGQTGISGYRIERSVNGQRPSWETQGVERGSGTTDCIPHQSSSHPYYDRLGNRVGEPTGTTATVELPPLRTYPHLWEVSRVDYYVYTLTSDDNISPPMRVEAAGALSVRNAVGYELYNSKIEFRVILHPASSNTVTVDYATSDGTAEAGKDYPTTTGTLTFGPGQHLKFIEIPIIDDDVQELDETLTLTLSNARGASIADSQATGTIGDFDSNNAPTGLPVITGTFQVGQTVTADTSGIADPEGLSNPRFSYQWHNNFLGHVYGVRSRSYHLTNRDLNRRLRVIVRFFDDAGMRHRLESEPIDVVAAQNQDAVPEEPLRAKGQNLPDNGHNGTDAFTLQIAFSDEVDISVEDMQDHALIASGATIDSVSKVEDRSDLWEVTLQPSGDDSVALIIAPTTDCAADGAICTGDGRPLSDGLAIVIAKSEPVENSPATGLPVISGAARAGETLTVSLSEVSDEDGRTRASYGYWWFRVDGEDETLIEDDDGARYTLTDEDVGKTIRVRVKFTDDASNVETLDSEPTATVEPRLLTAAFLNEPTSHNGQNAFTFELRFSEEVELSYQTLRDHALTVTGGEVTGASRLDKPSNIRWRITVEPDSDDGVTVVLPATADCSAQGAVCTGGGKILSEGVELTVPGPPQQPQNSEATGAPTISGTVRVGETLTAATSGIGDADGLDNASFTYQWMRSDGNAHTDIAGETGRTYELSGDDVGKTIKVRVSFDDDAENEESLTSAATETVAPRPPLTASFQGQPSSHDGQADFTFELRFSEHFGISYLSLRDHAFTVTGGTVGKAQRLTPGSNIGWRIIVTPDSSADVTVLLPVTTDCDATGAICTGDGRKLSNSLSFTVGGPGG